MLDIQFPRHGAVLNHNHGIETEDALLVTVRGIAGVSSHVVVNGVTAERKGRAFKAEIPLRTQINEINVTSHGRYGDETAFMKVIWDKKSFPRYNFYIDDHSFFLTDIAHDRPKSLFDHFYLKGLRDIHTKYGTKFTLNIFYRNDHHPFEIKDFPDIYKPEWKDNTDWLRLSFHAYSEFPDRCYSTPGSAPKLMRDFRLVQSEIERFAGPETFIQPPVIHWAVPSRDCVAALAKNGMKFFSGGFRGVADKCKEAIAKGIDPTITDIGLDMAARSDIGYDRTLEDAIYLFCYCRLFDFDLNALFFNGAGVCCNLYTPEEIRERLEYSINMKYGNDTFGLASHEQYTFPYYERYIPDHMFRIETAARTVTEHGCKPTFFSFGLLGNHAWDNQP